jgi:hypothetical protein
VHPAYFRDPCTVLHKRKISAGAGSVHNHNKSLPLRRNWLRSAKPRATRPNRYASEAASGQKPNRSAHSRGFVAPRFSAIRAQECTSPKPLPLAATRITKAKDSHLSKIGFLPQKTPSASADCASAPVGCAPQAPSASRKVLACASTVNSIGSE